MGAVATLGVHRAAVAQGGQGFRIEQDGGVDDDHARVGEQHEEVVHGAAAEDAPCVRVPLLFKQILRCTGLHLYSIFDRAETLVLGFGGRILGFHDVRSVL